MCATLGRNGRCAHEMDARAECGANVAVVYQLPRRAADPQWSRLHFEEGNRRRREFLPESVKKHISPHVVRHATATHLLQAGVDISVIALWLGHESIDTTHIYMESNLAHKEEALGRLQPAGQRMPRFHATDKVMAFLETL